MHRAEGFVRAEHERRAGVAQPGVIELGAGQGDPRVERVSANWSTQTVVVGYDQRVTDANALAAWIDGTGCQCTGEPTPQHLTAPLGPPLTHRDEARGMEEMPGMAGGGTGEHAGHGGDMSGHVRAVRNSFIVAAVIAVPILLYSPIGRDVLGWTVRAPFGLSDQWLSLLLSVPVIFYADLMFFTGAWQALKARTLDMMVLVAVAVGTG